MLEIAPSARGQMGPVALIGLVLALYPLVRATGLIPGWLSRPPLLRSPWGSDRWPVVAPVPRQGATMPPLRPPGGPGRSDRLGGVRQRRYGSRLLLMPHATTASTEEIPSAVQRWGGVTVSDRRRSRRS